MLGFSNHGPARDEQDYGRQYRGDQHYPCGPDGTEGRQKDRHQQTEHEQTSNPGDQRVSGAPRSLKQGFEAESGQADDGCSPQQQQ